MKYVLALALLLVALFTLQASAQNGVATGMLVTASGGATNPLSNWTAGWNVIVPTNTSSDVTTLQNAVNGSQPVLMAPGTWQICSQVSVPANQKVEGVYVNSDPGSSAASQTYSKTIVTCPNNGSFSAGQAYIALKDHDVLRGIDFYCHDGAAATFNGINALNAVAPEIDHNSVYFCSNGISRYSDGNVPGYTVAYSQLAKIHDNLLYKNINYGYYADYANGGFVSDEIIGPNNDFAVNLVAAAYVHAGTTEQIFNNRFEDGPLGVWLVNGLAVSITGNLCDKIQCLLITNSNTVSVAGNHGDWNSGFLNSMLVEFSGTNINIQFAGNAWYNTTAVYKVDAGGVFVNSAFNEVPSTGAGIYVDNYSQSIIQPLMPANVGSVSSLSAAVSSTAVDANVSNLITGGDGMTGGSWAANALALTLATAAGANPYGATTAVTLTEDSSTATHSTFESIAGSASTTYTYSLYIHPGTVGTDGIGLSVTDSSYGNVVYAYFNPATGGFVSSAGTGGNGSVISTGSQLINNGWYRVWVTFTLGVSTPAYEYLFLAQGAANYFTGNGTNNLLIWGPAMRASTVP